MALPAHGYYCFEVINARLNGKEALIPEFDDAEEFPLFVTWNTVSRSGGLPRLRGCIGNFGAAAIGEGLRDYAGISAFKDKRFSPITAKELPRLECGVSLLTDFELCDSYLDWTLNTHGIYISLPNPALTPPSSTPSSSSSSSSSSLQLSSSTPRASYRSISHLPTFLPPAHPNPRRLPTVLTATYLPDVPGAQGWTKMQAVDSAIRKAGWSGKITEEMRGSLRLTRYQSKKVEVTYEEWRTWRETVEV